MRLWILLLLTASSASYGFQLREFSLSASSIKNKYDAYSPQYTTPALGNTEQWSYGLGLDLNFDIINYQQFRIFWDNSLLFDRTDKQLRQIDLQTKVGIPIGNWAEIYYTEFNRHCMECNNGLQYPKESRWVLKVRVWRAGK